MFLNQQISESESN